jgi:apolipoprotein N-acyltransferase
MKPQVFALAKTLNWSIRANYLTYAITFLLGSLGTLGFAPFHLPGMTLFSIAYFYTLLVHRNALYGFKLGFWYGLGYFGFGVSWVFISIHEYGGLNYPLSMLTTLLFIIYLSLFPSLLGLCFNALSFKNRPVINAVLFAILWCLSEWMRNNLFTGFPWLQVSTSQTETPLKYLFPVLGPYGISLISVFSAAILATAMREQSKKRYYYIIAFVLMIMAPSLCKQIHWTDVSKKPVSVGVVQANLAMRDKWDDSLFWSLLDLYEKKINTLLGKQLIILPESAIPLPANYLTYYLTKLSHKAKAAKSGLILGILQPTDDSETHFYNSIISLGTAKGQHIKRHLVPFGEYIPQIFTPITKWLDLLPQTIKPGAKKQPLIKVAGHPIASLICYEIAYPELLRVQIPKAEWIVSISDNGWFGHSFASYQQLQMGQVLSLLTGKYHILVNNDGLSSIINNQGEIERGLPSFSSGILEGDVFPASGITPWVFWGNTPVFFICLSSLFIILLLRFKSAHQH